MRVFEDEWNRGLIGDGVFANPTIIRMADLVVHGLGTHYEPQRYSEEERLWAYHALGKRYPGPTSRKQSQRE